MWILQPPTGTTTIAACKLQFGREACSRGDARIPSPQGTRESAVGKPMDVAEGLLIVDIVDGGMLRAVEISRSA